MLQDDTQLNKEVKECNQSWKESVLSIFPITFFLNKKKRKKKKMMNNAAEINKDNTDKVETLSNSIK